MLHNLYCLTNIIYLNHHEQVGYIILVSFFSRLIEKFVFSFPRIRKYFL